jgi:hypothetical protein
LLGNRWNRPVAVFQVRRKQSFVVQPKADARVEHEWQQVLVPMPIEPFKA